MKDNLLVNLLIVLFGFAAAYAALVIVGAISPGCGYAPKAKQTQSKIALAATFKDETNNKTMLGGHTR